MTKTTLTDLDGTEQVFAVREMNEEMVLVEALPTEPEAGAFWVTRAGFEAGRVIMVPLYNWPR